MDTEKRFIIAFTLCIVVILLHSAYMSKVRRQYQVPHEAEQTVSEPQALTRLAPIGQEAPAQDGDISASVDREPVKEETITVSNKLYRAVFSNLGGGIKELYMVSYGDQAITPIQLCSFEEDDLMVLGTEDTAREDRDRPWELVSSGGGVVVYSREDAYTKETKSIRLHNTKYSIELQLNIFNKSAAPVNTRYKITGGQALVTDNQSDNMHAGVDVKTAGKIYRKKPSDKKLIGGQVFIGRPDWASVRSRYFCFVLQPDQPEQAAFMAGEDGKKAWPGIIMEPGVIQPGETLTHTYKLYAGPNDRGSISALGLSPKEILGYWVSSSIAQVLLRGLRISYNIFGNYGVGIVIITMIIGAAMFPLTKKTLDSAKKTQKIQPEVERIRKEYKDKPDKMNKAIMELYKKHGVNPLGGCLPLFLQLPIFLSIFQILPRSIELRGANFLWIKDLSGVDSLLTLPGKLPIIGNSINLLPILMAAATMIQQKLSHPGGDVTEQQRMMSFIMPVMLCFIFYNMPSCIVLYWLTNTVTTLLIQEVVLKVRKRA